MKHAIAISSVAVLLAGCSGEPPCDRDVVGRICTFAGTGANNYSGDDGPALEAELSLPQDSIVAQDGSVFILDWNNNRIRKVTPDGIMVHVAGSGEFGGGDPSTNDLNHPTGLLLDPEERFLYVATWFNSVIRRIDLATGDIVDVIGDGRRDYRGDDTSGPSVSLDLPTSLVWDPQGQLVIMDQVNQVIRYVEPDGTIRRLAGRCVIDAPPDICVSPAVPEACPPPSNKSTCGDPATTCIHPCSPGFEGEGTPAIDMRMSQPFGGAADPGGRLAYDRDGNLYFADTRNALIRKIDPQGLVHTVAGTAPVDGVPQRGYAGDGGPATAALLDSPVDLALDEDGTLYVTDTYNHCVRAVFLDGTIDTVVGQCGQQGDDADDVEARDALLDRPYGLDYHDGHLYVSDTVNHRIRVVRLR